MAHKLRELRTQQCLTQKELAQKAKICVRTVVGIENLEVYPQPRTRRRLLEALGLTMAQAKEVFPYEVK